jgi:hypothetical protein
MVAEQEQERIALPVGQTWQRRLLGLLWYVHAPVILIVHATPTACLQILATTTRPSTQRLQHRNLFVSGRRYDLQARQNGFRMRTTSKVSWHYRYRTRSAAVLDGTFFEMSNEITRIQLDTHISIRELVDFVLVPSFMTSIILFVPWHPAVIAGLVFTLYSLSWIAHRNNATLEANEMIFFVQKALEELEPADIKSLDASTPDLIYGQFDDEWEKFYRRHQR